MKFWLANFQAHYRRLGEKLWEGDNVRHSHWRRLPIGVLRLTIAVLRDMREGRFDERAASLSYTTLLSFAPLLAVMFSVLKGLGVHDVIEPFLRSFLRPLGPSADDVTQRLVSFVENIQISVLGAVGVALLLWGVVAMMQKIEQAFNDIWRVSETRNMLQRLRDYLSVLMIGPVLLFLSMGMTAALRHANLVAGWLHIDLEGENFGIVFGAIPYLLFMLAFTALYMFMPNTRVRTGPALVAGLLTGIIWKILGKLFGIFVVGSASYAAIYSAFAAMVLFMIWVYAGWMTVLAGAAICYFLQHTSNQSMSRMFRNLSLRVKEKLALQVCVEIGQAFYKHDKPLTVAQLAARLRLPAIAVEDVTDDMVAMDILAETGRDGLCLMPSCPFDTTSVEDMLKKLRAADEAGVLQLQKIQGSPAVNTVLKLQDKALHGALGKITLKQLALGSIET